MTPRKAEIVGVAGHLFAERGYQAASLRDIGSVAGMRRGSLYAHFASKEEILRLVLEPALADLAGLLDAALVHADDEGGDAAATMERAVRDAVATCVRWRDALLILLQDRRVLAESAGLEDLSEQAVAITDRWIAVMVRAQSAGVVRADLKPESVVFGLYGLLLAVLSDRHLGLQRREVLPTDTDELATVVLDLFLEGARPR